MQNEEDGLESFPLEPENSAGPTAPNGDWMNAFPDERLTDVVVIDHKTVSVPPAQVIYVGKRRTPAERALELLRHHALATSLVALTVLVAPVAIVLGARGREVRDARPVASELPLAEPTSREVSADRHSPGVGGPPADTLKLSNKPVRDKEKEVAPRTMTPKPPSRSIEKPTAAPATPEPSAPVPAPPPAPMPMVVRTPTVTSAPTLPISTPTSTPASTPTPTPNLPAAPPASTGREVETAAIKSVLDRYRQAFDTLSVAPVEAYWPSINAKGLTRAFGQLDSQTVTFDSCDLDVNREQATATCIGRAKFTTKVGSRTPHVESRRWAFRLARMSDRWVILSVESR